MLQDCEDALNTFVRKGTEDEANWGYAGSLGAFISRLCEAKARLNNIDASEVEKQYLPNKDSVHNQPSAKSALLNYSRIAKSLIEDIKRELKAPEEKIMLCKRSVRSAASFLRGNPDDNGTESEVIAAVRELGFAACIATASGEIEVNTETSEAVAGFLNKSAEEVLQVKPRDAKQFFEAVTLAASKKDGEVTLNRAWNFRERTGNELEAGTVPRVPAKNAISWKRPGDDQAINARMALTPDGKLDFSAFLGNNDDANSRQHAITIDWQPAFKGATAASLIVVLGRRAFAEIREAIGKGTVAM